MIPRHVQLGLLLVLQAVGVQSLGSKSSEAWLLTPVNSDRAPVRLSLTHDRADNALPQDLLAFTETWTVRAQDSHTGVAHDEGEVFGHGEWTWADWKLTVFPRAYRLRVLPNADAALLIVDWIEARNARGLVHAVDIYRLPLDGGSAVSAESAAPLAQLRRPSPADHRRLEDVLVGDRSLTLVVKDDAGTLEFRLDLKTLEWHEVHVAPDAVPGIVERVWKPLFPGLVLPPTDPPADAPPPSPPRHPR